MSIAMNSKGVHKTDRFVGFYCALVVFAMQFAIMGVFGVGLQFILKDHLKLPATEVATFGLLTDVPVWFGFAFGFLRDRWRPAQFGDRAYFLLAAPALAITYIVIGRSPMTYGWLIGGVCVTVVLSLFLGAATRGLIATVGKAHGMTGRLASISNVFVSLGVVVSTVLSGQIGEATLKAAPGLPFILSAIATVPIFAIGLWRPAKIFDVDTELVQSVIPEGVWDGLKRLARHKEIYVPSIAMLLWAFAPGWGTPLFFYLTKTVHLTESQYGNTSSLIRLGTVLSSVGYAGICLRFRLLPIYVVGTIFGVMGGAIFLLIHSTWQAYAIAFLAGCTCGIPVGAYLDLLVRCCPKELEGAAMMFYYSASIFAGDWSDVFGSWLYDRGGFGLALFATMTTTCFILVLVPFIPRAKANLPEGTPVVDDEPAPELAMA